MERSGMLRWVTYGARGLASKTALALFLAAPVPGAAQNVELLALGDSLTQGYGLPFGQGFVPQLQSWLDDRGVSVDIVNAGVSGDTTAGGLSRVEWSLTPEIDAMIVALGGNDLLRGIAPEVARGNLDGILQVAEEREIEVLLIGMEAPGNYGADYKAAFDAIYPDLAQRYETLYLESFFAGLTQETDDPAALRDYMQDDGIHPNADGVARIVAAVGPLVEELVVRARE